MDHQREMTQPWVELVQGMTMMPVLLVHSCFLCSTPRQALVGMVHSSCSFLFHTYLWWHQMTWPDYSNTAIWLYIADKSTIMMMMWGFHHYFHPFMATIMFLPCLLDVVHIVLYQHESVDNKYAYYDLFLLAYILQVVVASMLFSVRRHSILFWFFCSMMGYTMEIPGFMHLVIAPGFWIWHDEIKKNFDKNKKDNAL